jgi:CheY-like chemotaxis protein
MSAGQQDASASVTSDGPRPCRVLAVDDEPALARMVALILASDGHTVSVATSGEDALEALAVEPFNVVISDLGMGAGMSGWDLAEIVRDRYPDLSFALTTAWGKHIDLESVRTCGGVQAVITKPHRVNLLRRLVAALARVRRGENPTPPPG